MRKTAAADLSIATRRTVSRPIAQHRRGQARVSIKARPAPLRHLSGGKPALERGRTAPGARPQRLAELDAAIRVCVQCPLCESRTIAVPGEGKANAKVMLIGEAPGKQEDETGR